MVEIWNKIKNESDLQVQVDLFLKKWSSITLKKKGSLLNFWSKQNVPAIKKQESVTNCSTDKLPDYPTIEPIAIEFRPDSEQFVESDIHESEDEYINSEASTSTKAITAATIVSVKPKPAQEEIKTKISIIDGDLVGLYNRKSIGFLTDEQEVELKEKKSKKKELETLLKRKIENQKRAKKSRDLKKLKLAKLCEIHPEIQNELKIRNQRGKPRLEVEQHFC